jgi:hypothetical protein
LKRTGFKPRTKPLPRGTSPMKQRKPIAKRSVKNSRNNRDESVLREYRKSHASCALCGAPTEEIHHIFGGKCRHHIWANLIALCVRFGHGCHTPAIHTPAGKIRCLWWKLNNDELDVAALDAMGSERLIGWLSRNEPTETVLHRKWSEVMAATTPADAAFRQRQRIESGTRNIETQIGDVMILADAYLAMEWKGWPDTPGTWGNECVWETYTQEQIDDFNSGKEPWVYGDVFGPIPAK